MGQAPTDKVERLVQNRQRVAAVVGHRRGRTDALPKPVPSVFHDAQRAKR